jgi:hypothetical protein
MTDIRKASDDMVRSEAWIATGQCVEQYGRAEPYLPVVEALGRLARESGETDVRGILEDLPITISLEGRRRSG